MVGLGEALLVEPMIADGVADAATQLAALAEAGVDASQGFLHARPMTEDALLAWMKQREQK